MSERVVSRVDETFDLVPVADVAAVRERSPTEALDFRRGLVACLLLPARHDDVRAGLRERAQDGAPEAPRATGDQGDTSAEIEELRRRAHWVDIISEQDGLPPWDETDGDRGRRCPL